jgi:lipopolysaccharide transport system permease protein
MSSGAETLAVEALPRAAVAPVGAAETKGEPPLTVIERKPGWHLLDLREMWLFRELLFFLMWRDIKVRYKQTVLGAAWAILQPLATMLAFSLFFGRVAGAEHPAVPYQIFVLAGLVVWTFFSSAVSAASNSVIGNERLVTKIYFPRILVPLSAVMGATVDFALAFVMMLVLMPFFGVWPTWSLLLVPAMVALILLVASSLGVLLSALTVTYRDFRYVVPFTIQLWMFVTPAIFLQDLDKLGPLTQMLLPLNPVHGLVVNFRAAAFGGTFDWTALGISAVSGVALLVVSSFYFRSVERRFADII